MHTPTTSDLDRLRGLTERYARYSRSAGGLSSVFGGILVLGVFLVGAFAPLTSGMRWALASAPLFWLLGKELLRALYYQRHGGVGEHISPQLQRKHRWMVLYLFAISALVVTGVLWLKRDTGLQGPMLGYLLLVVALPVVAMRWFWSESDFLVGVLLFCQAAVVFAGGHYGGAWIAFAGLGASIAVVNGIREHREFLQIREQLRHGAETSE